MNDKYSLINKAGEFRIFLHRLLLENNTLIELLTSYINGEFDTTSTEYVPEWEKFKFKIKKTNLKKKENFTHTVDFYYAYIDNAIYNFIMDPITQMTINTQIPGSNPNSVTNQLQEIYDAIRSKSASCRYLYNITTTQDNTVVLNI